MDEAVNNIRPEDGEVYVLDYLIILAKYSRMIIFASAAVTVLTYFNLFCASNTYSARARMMPPQQNLTMSGQILEGMRGGGSPGVAGSGQGGGLGSMAANMLGLTSPGGMYVTMMKSDTVLDRIISRFQLAKLFGTRYIEDTRAVLIGKSKITANKTDSIINIEVTSSNRKQAAELANAFIEELDRLLQGLALQEAKGRLAFLEKERLQASQKLSKAEDSVRRFSEQNSVLQIDTQTRGAIEYIARLRAEIDAKEVSIQVLRQQATPMNYDVVRMETEVKGLREKLRAAEAQRENCVSDVCLPTNKAPSLGLEYLRLFREAKFQEGLYQLYTKLVAIAHTDMVRQVAVVQVLAPATPPERRSNKRLIPSIIAGILSFFMMSFVAFGLEYIQNMNTKEDGVQRLAILKDHLQPWTDMLLRIKKIIGSKIKL